MATLSEVKAVLTGHYGLTIASERSIQAGTQVSTDQGPKVNVFDTGKCHINGKNLHLISDFDQVLASQYGSRSAPARKVFVVYGHDTDARTQLEAMLRRWNLEPILMDQLTSEGDTLIEKLERSMNEAAFAVVLATPDDEGFRRGSEKDKKYRARQNVVLELGMMLRGLGRKRVAILMPQLENGVMEKPSDIDGLIYIPYTDKVDDARVQLAKELHRQGLQVDVTAL